jgi:single-strand DNA-binding protein
MSTSSTSINLAVLRGTVSSDPLHRELASGDLVVQFDVTTVRSGGGPKVSVPVSWPNPPSADLRALEAELEVLVVGAVQRRFFRAAGLTQSRTEVVAERVVPVRRTRTVSSLLDAAAASLSVAP